MPLNQALAALLFLYRELLERDLDLEGVVRARTRRRLPVVLCQATSAFGPLATRKLVHLRGG